MLGLTVATLYWPSAAFAKRRDPNSVPPVVWQGVEYRAPLDVEHMGHVQAFDLASGRKLWETKVYHVWIIPLLEEDVQWVFISNMEVQGGTLLVKNEKGHSFRLNLKTGQNESALLFWVPWALAGIFLTFVAFVVRIRSRRGCRAAASG